MKKNQWIKMITITGGLLLCGISGIASAETWRWKENGNWVYGDRYPKNAETPEKVVSKNDKKNETEKDAKSMSGLSNAEKAAKFFPVTVYGVNCPSCESAKKVLEERHVPVMYKDPTVASVYEEFKKLSPDSLAPVILIGDKKIVGFEVNTLNGALDDAGYDKKSAFNGTGGVSSTELKPRK